MKFARIAAVIAALFACPLAHAQTSGSVTNHAFAVGKGPGITGYTSLLCASAQLAVGQAAADPVCQTITGDVTISAGGVTAIGAGVVHSSMLNADVFSTAHSWSATQSFPNNSLTLAELPAFGAAGVLGATAAGNTAQLTQAQLTALINPFTTTLNGSVPNPGTATGKFLRDDSTWQPIAGSGTLTNAAIAAGAGAVISGTCSSTTSINCTVSSDPSYFPNHLAGLVLSNDGTTPNSVLDIASGAANDSTNAVFIKIGAFTKSTAGAWASGSGSNGMGNGLTIANSTWYHVCLANNSGTPDYWFDTSATCANRPAGISDAKFRRVGSFKTDAASHIIAFTQSRDEFWWNNPLEETGSAITVGTTRVTQTIANVPSGVVVEVIANFFGFGPSPSAIWVGPLSVTDAAPGIDTSPGPLQWTGTSTVSSQSGAQARIPTNTSAQIGMRASAASSTVRIFTQGWRDFRGQ